jgi:hypothetical protein
MKKFLRFSLLFVFTFWMKNNGIAQCKIEQEISPTGVNVQTTQRELIYNNTNYNMYSQILDDGGNFYLILIAKPFPKKKVDPNSIRIILENKDTLDLDFYDQNYRNKDSSINCLFRIKEEQIEPLSTLQITKIELMDGEILRQFILKFHKDLIKQQLLCIRENAKK